MVNIFEGYRIFIDTCSLMHPCIEEVINKGFKANIKDGSSKLVISYRVVKELKKKASSYNKEESEKAKRAIKILDDLIKLNNVMYLGCEEDSFADHNFIEIYLKYGDKIQMVLITQDVKLTKALKDITNENMFNLNKIKLLKINYYKRCLVEWEIRN